MTLQRSGSLFGCLFLLAWGLFPVRAAEPASPEIVLTSPDNLKQSTIEVRNLPAALHEQIFDAKADEVRFGDWLSVYVGKSPKPGQPAILGSFELTKKGFAFRPRFPFEAGLAYSAKLSLPGQKSVLKTFEIPAEKPAEPTVISEVYPTGKKLPENLLRLYLHFSAPMSQGRSYHYLHLYDEAGEEVENPFLEVPQELWSGDGKRLTVLLDPGRVKQGLKPREQSGPILVPGRKYTLTIDEAWPDAQGQPLARSFKRTFETTKADIVQPNPDNWKITPPLAGSRQPVSVKFDEPLDHGMLKRVLAIVADGRVMAGRVQVDQQETRWRFTPEKPWKAGDYLLRVRSNLEDRVGNSIARPFEVDLSGPPLPKVPKVIERRFEIAESPER